MDAIATTTILLISLAVFLVGLLIGWVISRRDENLTKSDLQMAVGLIVTIVWVVSIGAEILIPAYTVSVLVHGIMGGVVGYLFSDEGITLNLRGKKK